MNGRKLFREYAQHLGKEAIEFVEVIKGTWGDSDTLVTKDKQRLKEHTSINYRDMVHWIIKKT